MTIDEDGSLLPGRSKHQLDPKELLRSQISFVLLGFHSLPCLDSGKELEIMGKGEHVKQSPVQHLFLKHNPDLEAFPMHF